MGWGDKAKEKAKEVAKKAAKTGSKEVRMSHDVSLWDRQKRKPNEHGV